MEQLTFSLAGLPARTSALPGKEPDFLENVLALPCTLRGWFETFALDGSCGKTCPVLFLPTGGETSARLPGRWPNSGMAWHGGFLTLSAGEFPSGAEESSLSDILEMCDLPERYFLSAKACAGILRRAEKRGKTLPERLHAALKAGAG